MSPQSLPLILEPSALEKIIPSQSLLIIAVVQANVFASYHIPGSVLIEPSELICGIQPGVGKLPEAEKLSAVFSRVGLRDDVHVIVYDDEGGGWAGRLIWTLDVLGHRNYSYLNGGLPAWLKLGLPIETGSANAASESATTNFEATLDQILIVDVNSILNQIDDPNAVVWDARAEGEYNGSKVTARRNGHIPGAINFDWLELMDRDNDLRLRPLSEIENRLKSIGISKDKKIITHCHTHHRSGLSYLVGKALNFDIKAYDGSWSEWGNHPDTPIEK
ncbi:MAG: thiosulfate sulfurtransferase [SAR86 cluster bacterium]|uniref:Thiosulfate sulfurtransferase n=1 Tax=SAR86 cluster bacterium TaxID=2030880 RepID=A0A2A5B866_9GAMM|nr:MAG: thiosulfate sulfurtransferase [SAR86 cluster bacterium]